jgi:hypothetical protein
MEPTLDAQGSGEFCVERHGGLMTRENAAETDL